MGPRDERGDDNLVGTRGMGLFLTLTGAAMIAMIVLHMRVRRHTAMDVSAGAFLLRVADAEQPDHRWSLAAPLASVLFWLRIAALAAVLLALLSALRPQWLAGAPSSALGVWLIVDQSYSMTGRDRSGGVLIDAAKAEGRAAIDASFAKGSDRLHVCMAISGLGRTLSAPRTAFARESAKQALDEIAPLPESANLSLIERARRDLASGAASYGANPGGAGCAITHIVVISDQSRKLALKSGQEDARELRLLWRQVEADPANVGIADVTTTANPLSGAGGEVDVKLAVPRDMEPGGITVTGPDGAGLAAKGAVRRQGEAAWARFALTQSGRQSGRYEARLEAGGSYVGDDRVGFEASAVRSLAVDWRIGDARGAERFNLRHAPGPDAVAVVSASDFSRLQGNERALLVGEGFSGVKTEIGLFSDHPVMEAINLDVFERSGPAAAPAALAGDYDFKPVAQDKSGGVLAAVRTAPKAVYIPGLPSGGAVEANDRAAAILFFNALRWLTDGGVETTPVYLTPEGEVIQGGAREWIPPVGAPTRDDLAALSPEAFPTAVGRLWRWLLIVGLALFVAERWLAPRREA
jgi:hypothetical protein